MSVSQLLQASILLVVAFLTSSAIESLSDRFPPVNDANEFATLSNIVYSINSCSDTDIIPDDVDCYWYDEKSDGTQYMLVVSDKSQYIAVVYAGTYSIDDMQVDMDSDLVPYGGPSPSTGNILVHEGFNNALYSNGVWDQLLPLVESLHQSYPSYRLITSGHSLGGAEAILTAAALAYTFPNSNIISITYGSPKIGDDSWVSFANSMSNLAIWRFVNEDDIIPRHPKYDYKHAGHTIQMNKRCVTAYYLHYGDENLEFNGVPSDWDATYPTWTSLQQHKAGSYVDYIAENSSINPDKFYVNQFSEMKSIFDSIFFWKQQSDNEC